VRKLPLSAEVRHVFDRMRKERFPLSVYGRSHARALVMVRTIINLRIRHAPLLRHQTNAYRLAAFEMTKQFRTLTGGPLAEALALVLRKWVNHGLLPDLLQDLLVLVYRKFDSAGHQLPGSKAMGRNKPGPKQRRKRHRTYRQALDAGRTPLRRAATSEAQAELHRKAVLLNREISRQVAALLKARGVPGRDFIRYNAFAQKLGKLCRTYTENALARAAADIVDLYEAKSLDHATLLAIADTIFCITNFPA
jgi:hypothetical protein